MAQSNSFPSRPNLMPQIYAYSDPQYEGMLKEGDFSFHFAVGLPFKQEVLMVATSGTAVFI